MSSEINFRCNLSIRKGNKIYPGRGIAFNADMTGNVGPTPGSITVETTGTEVDLTQIQEHGGVCELFNEDDTNYVEYGIWNGVTWEPLGELPPGEGYVLRLSRRILYGMTGTALVNTLKFYADTAACVVWIGAFDK